MKKIVFVISVLIAATALQAQNVSGTAQAEKAMRDMHPGDSVPPLYEEENTDIGPQTILRPKKQPWVRASVDAQAFYTDNMLYSKNNQKDAGVAVTSLEAALMTPPCMTALASYRAEVGYRHQFVNYFGHDDVLAERFVGPRPKHFDADDFDFDASTIFANVSAQTKHYQFGAGVDLTRLYGFKPLRSDDYHEFYREVVPRWSVQRNFRVCDKSMFTLAYLGSYHFTHEERSPLLDAPSYFNVGLPNDRSERWEHTFLAGYTMALPHNFSVQPFYRFQLNDFVDADVYMIHTAGLSAGWYPCANFSLRGFVGYNWSDAADKQAVEYSKLDAGGGVNATFRF